MSDEEQGLYERQTQRENSFDVAAIVNTSRLSKLSNPNGKWLLDTAQGLWVYHVNTPHLFIQATGYLKHVHSRPGLKAVFYRGQENLYGGELRPSLYRCVTGTRGQSRLNEILNNYLQEADAKKKCLRIVSKYAQEPLLQHYGIKTRWIDLVDNVWVALWFACYHAYSTGKKGEFLHFEQRKNDGAAFAYVLLVETDWHQDMGKPGLYTGDTTETIDLRIAAPSVFIRPHVQHAIVTRMKPSANTYPMNYGSLITGIVRVSLKDALEWLGDGVLLTPHVLFPPPVYDLGYRNLLDHAPETQKELGAINHIGA